MIRFDRKLCRDILRITTDYNTSIIFDPAVGGFALWHLHHPDRAEVIPSIPLSEVPASLSRLEERSMIQTIQRSMNGAVIFRIRPELLHAKAFCWDRFTKKFWGGFVSGILVGLIANLLTAPVQSLLSALFRLLLNH